MVRSKIDDKRNDRDTRSRSSSQNNESSLIRRFTQLQEGTRAAINESFLLNVKPGSTQASKMTVTDALKEYYSKDDKQKQQVISKIFSIPKPPTRQKSSQGSRRTPGTGSYTQSKLKQNTDSGQKRVGNANKPPIESKTNFDKFKGYSSASKVGIRGNSSSAQYSNS